MRSAAVRVLMALLAAMGGAAAEAVACSCFPPGPPCQAAWSADAVFSGTVRSIDPVNGPDADGSSLTTHIVRFDVPRVFRGIASGPVSVETSDRHTCSYRFEKGQAYLVYATRTASGALTASICSRTRPLEAAAEDLAYLSAIPAAGSGGRVFGRIVETGRHPADPFAVDYGPMEGMSVTVRGEPGARVGLTDADGRFEIAGLPAGQYVVSTVSPPGFRPDKPERDIEIRDVRACAEVNFSIAQAAAAFGVVHDGAGRPAAGVEVDAVASELAGFSPPPHHYPVRTDARGFFEFQELPPGEYVFGVGLTRRSAPVTPPEPLFLPGTARVDEARTVDLKAGDRTDLGVLQLRPR